MKWISLIIPVYNVEKYLDECMKSVLNQTMQPDEIILVDDGSADSSGVKCDQYAAQHSNVHVIHKKNEGLGYARNTGMNCAHSEYIMFLDSDDYIKPDMIESLYMATEEGKYDLVKSGFIRVDANGTERKGRKYTEEETFFGEQVIHEMIPRMLGSLPEKHDSIEMDVTNSLIRRAIVVDKSLCFPSEKEWISEDLIFNLRFLPYLSNAKIIPYEGYYYRRNPNSLTVRYLENRFDSVCKLYSHINQEIDRFQLGKEANLRWDKTFFIYLWMCILQEKKQKIAKSRERILTMCRSQIVHKAIDSYPITKLGKKQQLFMTLLKLRAADILWAIAQFS